jgi:AbiV family abortive infection protein
MRHYTSSFSPSAPPKHQKNPLAVHKKKHFVAACAGALVNSRMDRILGMERVKEFLAICDKGLLEQLRQSCLYSDIGPAGNMLLPNEKIDKAQSLFYVSLAGEILAEVGGVEPITWDKLLEKVSKFENENGMAE